MSESLAGALSGTALKAALLQAVVAEDLDQIPPDFESQARFVICAVRAVARRQDIDGLTIFVYSDAPMSEGKPFAFQRIMHMQDGHGVVTGMTILTSQDANNGACHSNGSEGLEIITDKLEALLLGGRTTVIWDAAVRTATVYPNGTADEQIHCRFLIPKSNEELSQDDVCEVLNAAYNDNLKNPSGHTAHLWNKGLLVTTAEDEIERHLKGQIAMFFAGRARPIGVLRQIPTSAGRTDLILTQKGPVGGPRMSGVVELKVLRGPFAADRDATTEGLSQGFNYRDELGVPFATLALYDVAKLPSGDAAPLLAGQNPSHLAAVRVRRFPIYNCPKAWRDAGAPTAA